MRKVTKVLKTVLFEILYVILSVIVCLVFPLLFLSVLPIYVFRWIIATYARHFKPELGKILTVRSSVFAVDDLYEKQNATLLTLLVVEGDLTPEEFNDILVRRLLNKKLPNSDELLHPELTRYIERWMGFYFWKPESNFSLDEHVIVPPPHPSFDEQTMFAYNNKLIEKSYLKKRSPWEFHLVRNYKPFGRKEDFSLTGIVFRCHHSLADGYSVLNLMTCSSDDKFGVAQPVRKARPAWKVFLERLVFPFRVPYEAVKVGIESFDANEWKLPEDKLERRWTGAYHPLIPLTRFKEIKTHYRVSLTSVILAVFCGTLRNFMLMSKVKVPEKIHCLTPLPLPGHTEKLRNFMTACFTPLPVGTADPIKRLYKIEKHLKVLKRSTFPWIASVFFLLCGGLMSPLLDMVAKSLIGTAVMTNFPGPDRRVNFFSRPLHELNFGGGMFRGTLSVGMSSISYNGMISFLIGLDQAICSNPEAKAVLISLITKEIEVLESFMTKTIEV